MKLFFNFKLVMGIIAYLIFNSIGFSETIINIKGVVLETNCSITGENDELRLEVDFGAINKNTINSVDTNEKYITLKIKCETPGSFGSVLKVFVKNSTHGNFSVMGNNVVKTSNDYLGIELMYDDLPLDIGHWVHVKGLNTTTPALVGLIKIKSRVVSPDISLVSSGDFTSSINIEVAYN